MRIAVIIPSFYPATIYGGTIFASLHFAKLMAESGHEIYVSTTNTNKTERLKVPTEKFIELDKNIFVNYYNETIVDKLSFPLLLNLRRDIKKADVVHIHAIFNTPVPAALLIARWMKKPVLLSPHGVLGEWVMKNGSGLKKLWLNLFIRPFASYVHWHATSEQEKREIRTHFPKAKVHIVANCINTSLYKRFKVLNKPDYLQRYGGKAGNPEKIIVSMGRLQKKKGFDILIKAFEKVCTKFPESFLFIAGEDEGEKENLLHLIKSARLVERIFLTGNLKEEEKIAFLGNADLFVLPSHNENFGIVYCESLATGTPVVASKETPWEEVERSGCGRWVNNTVEETYEAIADMLNKPKTEVQEKAVLLAEKFSFQEIKKELEKVLTLISGKNA